MTDAGLCFSYLAEAMACGVPLPGRISAAILLMQAAAFRLAELDAKQKRQHHRVLARLRFEAAQRGIPQPAVITERSAG